MVLHTLSTSPDHPAFLQCLSALRAQDALLLMGDGVYAALLNSHPLNQLRDSGAAIHVLASDASAAGLTSLPAGLAFASMLDFVELTERYPRQMAWY
jgi:tRNA 2-thiouridine synthesizing protein B